MSDAKVRGIVHFIDETKSYGQKGFRKRMVVLEQKNDRFPNYVPVEFMQDGCDTVNDLNVGDDVEVTYRLAGRKWQKDPSAEVRYFLNAEAYSFKVMSNSGGESGSVDDANRELAEADYDEGDVPF
ncbi:MAG: DUF3127 domain-containing protein [Pirellulaceae bacterium]|nr:DUF3127 domain-containing protein [Planctomycetales bacterium]